MLKIKEEGDNWENNASEIHAGWDPGHSKRVSFRQRQSTPAAPRAKEEWVPLQELNLVVSERPSEQGASSER